jgi:hypothetical protein
MVSGGMNDTGLGSVMGPCQHVTNPSYSLRNGDFFLLIERVYTSKVRLSPVDSVVLLVIFR